MKKLQFYKNIAEGLVTLKQLKEKDSDYGIYPSSVCEKEGSILFLVKEGTQKQLVVIKEGPIFEAFEGKKTADGQVKVCPLSHNNSVALRKFFPFTAPRPHRGHSITIGLGDRLGIASAGHIRLIRDYPVFPILAQQSIRELTLTGRTYDDVLDAASWAVFQEGYRKGFGADGDHLKNEDEVRMALEHGFTMITLDCSEHIDNSVPDMSQEEVDKNYASLPADVRSGLEERYMGKSFTLKKGGNVYFSEESFKRIVLIYRKAIEFTVELYNKILSPPGNSIDFEMSIDETLTPTSPEAHYFVASELVRRGVKITSLAPRFCGEFQKGIDYIGDINQFKREFKQHVAIAEHFGYKLSIHSGSDKFKVFPIIGEETGGRFHLKTAGTNWLEAMRIVAEKAPELYREIHKFALEHLEEAKKYYHISADIGKIPDVDTLSDDKLPVLMNEDDSRQLIHITYGLILQAKNEDGTLRFKNKLYDLWNRYENEYYEALYNHIGKHLECLGIKKEG